MIKTIIFDFGNVFINLDMEGAHRYALDRFQMKNIPEDMTSINSQYEQGFISTNQFLDFYSQKFPELSTQDLIDIWNFILKDFPLHRLEFLKTLKTLSNYNLILLSNTNELHINWIKDHVSFYEEFKSCFNKFYLSHEIHLAKPHVAIYDYVLEENKLKPEECLFIDDNEHNILSAKTLHINTWHIDPEIDDVSNLFIVHKDLFN